MPKQLAIRIIAPPPRIGASLAQVLTNLSVSLRDALLPSAVPPPGIREEDFLLVLNDDLRKALTEHYGISEASRLFPFLPLGRATAIAKDCCQLVED